MTINHVLLDLYRSMDAAGATVAKVKGKRVPAATDGETAEVKC